MPNRFSLSARGWLALLALFLIGAAGVGLRLTRGDTTWARLQRGGVLRVAIDPSFPPFDNLDANGQVAGFDVDLAQELGRRLGVPVQFQAIAFDGLVDAVIAGKADAVISAFPHDPRLTADVRFSRPYFEAGLVLVTPTGAAGQSADRAGQVVAVEWGSGGIAADRAGQVVAVEWGSGGDAWARGAGLTVLRRESAAAALTAARTGEAAAAIVDAVTFALTPAPDLVAHAPPLSSEPYVIVLPKTAPRLAAAIDEALAAILADGMWATLAAPYFPQPPLPPPAGDDE